GTTATLSAFRVASGCLPRLAPRAPLGLVTPYDQRGGAEPGRRPPALAPHPNLPPRRGEGLRPAPTQSRQGACPSHEGEVQVVCLLSGSSAIFIMRCTVSIPNPAMRMIWATICTI